MSPLTPSRWRIRVEPLKRSRRADDEAPRDPWRRPHPSPQAAGATIGALLPVWAAPLFLREEPACDRLSRALYEAAAGPQRPRLGLKLDRRA